jgi:hypothetical protein
MESLVKSTMKRNVYLYWLETAFTMKPKSDMEPVLYKKLIIAKVMWILWLSTK